MLVLWLVVLYGGSTTGRVLEALHDHMTDSEWAYYFQDEDRNSVPEYEVVFLPEIPETEAFDYNFDAFQKPIQLKLRKNNNIAAPGMQTYITEDEDQVLVPMEPRRCHFLHQDGGIVAAISACEPRALQGVVLLEDSTLEIHPLTDRLQALITEPLLETLDDISTPHIVKRANFILQDDALPTLDNLPLVREAASHRPASHLTVEVAMFFDEAAFKIFGPFLDNDDRKLQDMLLAYMNGVQALYHHPSLGTTIELVLVRLDIMKRQPTKLPHYKGERSQLLDSFCVSERSQQ